MREKRRIFNRLGMSLIELLAVVTIMSVVFLMVASTMNDVFKWQNQVAVRDESNEFATSLSRYLLGESSCSTALLGTTFPVGGEAPLVVRGYEGYAGSTTGEIQSDQNLTKDLRVNTLVIRDKGIPGQTVMSGGVNYTRYVAQVVLSMQVRDPNQDNPTGGVAFRDRPARTYEFPVLVNPGTNEIVRCFLEMQVSDACALMGSVVDPVTGLCQPTTQCFFEGHMIDHSCNPNVRSCPRDVPNDITRTMNCPSGLSTRKETGIYRYSYTESCGKKCTRTVNVTSRYYICLKCE